PGGADERVGEPPGGAADEKVSEVRGAPAARPPGEPGRDEELLFVASAAGGPRGRDAAGGDVCGATPVAQRPARGFAVAENDTCAGPERARRRHSGPHEGRDDVTTSTDRTDGRRDGKPSIGDLVSTLSEKLSTLIRHEIELAKAEMAEKAKHAGLGIGLFVGAGVLAFWATGVLIA